MSSCDDTAHTCPDELQLLFQRGVAFTAQGDYVRAEFCYRRILALAPSSTETLLNLGYVYDQTGRVDKALQCYESVLNINPADAKARYNRAAHLLRAGEFINGFTDYEYRFAAIPGADDRSYAQPRWDGSSLAGRSILVFCEQGLGDALMFARYIPLLTAMGATVILEAQQPLTRLLSATAGIEQVVVKSVTPPLTDVYIPLLSLPHIFNTTLTTIPGHVPYLTPADTVVSLWKDRVTHTPGSIAAGLVWSGKPHPYPNRSCPPEYLEPLLAIPGVRWHSLQVGDKERFPLPALFAEQLIDLTGMIDDFADTAALIMHLDLVITIDTAVAHLAGALGKPVWVMLPYDADWRWLTQRQDSPWYPSMRLFRQTAPNNWTTVVTEIAAAFEQEHAPDRIDGGISGHEDALFDSALEAIESGNFDSAITALAALIQQQPDDPAIRFNLGRAYDGAGKPAEAERHYRQALQTRPGSPAILYCLGRALMALKCYQEAETILHRAHELMPESIEILLDYGLTLVQRDKVGEAYDCCNKILALDPAHAAATYNLAYLQLRSGDFAAGFTNFEARLDVAQFNIDRRRYAQPRWDGSPPDGKSILVFGEQGMGDVIQFCRYVPLLAERGAHVILEVDEPLVSLLMRLHGVAGVVPKSASPPVTDFYVQLLSLPHFFGTTVTTIPRRVPYLTADQAKVAAWRHTLGSDPAFRIGIVWRGNPKNPLDSIRSCRLADFSPLADVPGIRLYSLQVGSGSDEAATAVPELPLVDFCDRLHSFDDTAALLENLDLVIGVDTATTHLAGALGKTAWVLLPRIYDWRWPTGQESSPWYPTVTVFRQEVAGEWGSVIARVKHALTELLCNRKAPPPDDTIDIEECYRRGALLKEQGELSEAEHYFRRIVEHDPELPDPQHALGVVLQNQGRLAEAIEHYRAAIHSDPAFVKAHFNLATSLWHSGRYAEAKSELQTTIALDTQHREAHWLYGMLLLLCGDFGNGWREYEWRWGAAYGPVYPSHLGRPEWDGAPLEGKTLLIHMEQGRGDMLQFIRYAPLIATEGTVIVAALAEMVSLLTTVPGVTRVVDRAGTLPAFDVHIPVMSLPRVMGTTRETIPAATPYLSPDHEKSAAWAHTLSRHNYAMRIGVVWSGNTQPDACRSCPFELIATLFSLPHAQFYSLQIGTASPAVQESSFIDYTDEIHDFSDTAALIANLDLIISIDTAVAHLAGAMRKPVWTLLPFVPDWRWLLNRSDTPWYPEMVLFRQTTPGGWHEVIERVAQRLATLCNAPAQHNHHGIALLKQGQCARAAGAFSLAAEIAPDNPEYHANLGAALDALGRYEEALACYQTAILLNPDFMQAIFNRGNTCRALGRLDEARACYERTVELSPQFLSAHLCLGDVLKDLQLYELARDRFAQALTIDATCADAWQGIGEAEQARDQFKSAITAYHNTVTLDPARVDAINLLGTVYQSLGQLDEAESCYRKALELAPGKQSIRNNLGTVLHAQERLTDTVALFRHIIAHDANNAEAHWNLALALLSMGDYQNGWQEYEWRFNKVNPVLRRNYPQPLWDGSPLNGRTVLLHCEQGFGDTLQFARFAPLVAQSGGKVIIECQIAALKRILLSLTGDIDVVVAGEATPHFDCHLPLLSVPLLFGVTVENLPRQVPYLTACTADIERWQERIGTAATFKVGIVWFGRQNQVLNRKRSCPLKYFAGLAKIPNVALYSLQIGEGTEQLQECAAIPVIDLTGHITDFADTAAFMANLDLVLTIDTAVAHLAGAVGARTWTLLPYGPDWRWLLNRSDSPWYPTMQLFRQKKGTKWPAVLALVEDSLRRCAASHRPDASSPPPGRSMVTPQKPNIRVGLAWLGRQDNPLNRKRSCPFSALAPLLELPHVTFVKLQLDAPHDMADRLLDLTGEIHTFADTAALMANLDLIISIDTSVAHLAAASGRPTWVLLSHVADWRWLTGRRDSPWYPNVELFRQPEHGDWDSVIVAVARRLAQFSGDTSGSASACNPVIRSSHEHSEEHQALERQLEYHLSILTSATSCPDAQLDVGTSLALLGRYEEAIAAFRRVLELNPDHVAGHLNLAYSLLTLGDYASAWRHLEWRLQRITPEQLPPWPMLQRNPGGEKSSGASVLVHCEQGFGDTIMFSRFLPLLGESGYTAVVSCPPPLVALIRSIPGVQQVIPHGEPLPRCDLQALLLSLPYLLSITLDTLPARVPYLHVPPLLKDIWGARINR